MTTYTDTRDATSPGGVSSLIWLAALAVFPFGVPALAVYIAAERLRIPTRSVLAAGGASAAVFVAVVAGQPASYAVTLLLAIASAIATSSCLFAAAGLWLTRPKTPPASTPNPPVPPSPPAPAAPVAPAATGAVVCGPQTALPVPAVALPEEIRLGTDVNGGDPTGLYPDELAAHALLLGATGSGKTTSLLTVAQGAVDLAIPVVAIDLKGSPGFRDRLAAIADLGGRETACWSINGDTRWNPLARGDASELKDKLVGMEAWTEPHYKRAAERYLQTLFTVLRCRDERPTLDRIVELMNSKALNAQLRDVPKPLADRVAVQIDQLADSPDQRSAIAGLATRLALLAESDAGDLLTTPTDDDGGEAVEAIDIATQIRAGNVCLFSLDSLRYPELAAQIAGLVIQDLKTVASELLAQGGQRALVLIDEFSALDGDQLLGLLARAREAGIGVLLSTQELADLARVAPTFAAQVIANTNVKLIHRQEVPDSAELLAGTIGTETEWEHTYAEHDALAELFAGTVSTVIGSRRLVEKYKLHPNTFKNLTTGQAVLSIKAPHAMVGVVDIAPPHTNPADRRAHTFEPMRRHLAPPPDTSPAAPRTPTILDLAGNLADNLLGRATGRL